MEAEDAKQALWQKMDFMGPPSDTGRRIPYLRFIVLILGVCAAAAPLSCHIAFTFAVACNNPPGFNRSAAYLRYPSNSSVVYFDSVEESLAFASYSAGTLIMLPFISFTKAVPVRLQVFVSVLCAGVLTLAFPFLFNTMPHISLASKFLHGIAAAPTIPLLGHICAHWSPKREIGLFVGAITCYSQFAILFTMSVSGVTCKLGGWRPIFYLHGAVTVMIAILWYLLFIDFPHKHPMLSNEEYLLIHTEQVEAKIENAKAKVPYRAVLKHKGIIAVLIAAIGNYNGISPLILFGALLMGKGLGSSEMELTYYNSFCFAAQVVFKLLSGAISDRLKVFSEKNRLRFFNTFSCGLSGAMMIGTAFLNPKDKVLCSVMLVVTQAIIGFNSAGFNRAAIIVAGKYSSFVMTIIGITISVSTIYEPFLVSYFAPEHTWSQWFPLLVVHGAVLLVTNFIFCLLTDGKPFQA